ncbi:hypothetical protein D0T49_00180 [Paludibacter sp. 221]|uniref:hypothetical protein n=1 Tax=Paludibacter sp. 221 TaxID=2302939 RepID=UPI0013D4B29B|nr:hypothetical protein [Paludibacter sp. 221]NDV45469.1 hypothetical protein [Paludibacter sp. 221]
MKTTLWIILDAIFLIVFNVLFFLIGGSEHPASVWISYGFIHFAYIMLLLTPLFVRKGSGQENYRRPLFGISTSYFFLELVIGVTFILIVPDNFKWALAIQLILMAVYIILMVANMIANEHTADSIEKRENELKYIKNASTSLDSIMKQLSDKELRRKVEKVYDLIHSSPTQSSYSVFQIEQDVINEIDNLQDAVISGDADSITRISNKIYRLAENRNRQLKFNSK